jgi:hypothetical protein
MNGLRLPVAPVAPRGDDAQFRFKLRYSMQKPPIDHRGRRDAAVGADGIERLDVVAPARRRESVLTQADRVDTVNVEEVRLAARESTHPCASEPFRLRRARVALRPASGRRHAPAFWRWARAIGGC